MTQSFPTDDPWAEQPPAAPPAPAVQQSAPQPPPAATSGGNRVSVTLKQHDGYNPPWIVFEGPTPEAVADLITRGIESRLHQLTARAQSAFQATASGGQPSARPQQTQQSGGGYQQAPQGGAQLPPGVGPRHCPHGQMTYREGNGQYGPYRIFTCPLPKGGPDTCKPISLGRG